MGYLLGGRYGVSKGGRRGPEEANARRCVVLEKVGSFMALLVLYMGLCVPGGLTTTGSYNQVVVNPSISPLVVQVT